MNRRWSRIEFGAQTRDRRVDRQAVCETSAEAIARGVVPVRLPSAGTAELAEVVADRLRRARNGGCWTNDDLDALPCEPAPARGDCDAWRRVEVVEP